MPDNHDWVPVGIILGFVALGLWHYHDHKDNDPDDSKDEQVVTNVPARFYRQEPYLVVDVPLNGQRRTVTHFSRGQPTASNLPVPLTQLPVVLTTDLAVGPPPAIAFVELVDNRLRVWKPVTADDNWVSDLLWFNSLNLQLWNVVGTNRRRLANVVINVPARTSSGTWSPPAISDLIFDANIPFIVPWALTKALPSWPAEFDYDVAARWDADGGFALNFLPPMQLPWQDALRYEGYRIALGVDMKVVLPLAVFTQPDPANQRRQAFFGKPETGGSETDVFVIKIIRGGPLDAPPGINRGNQIGQITYSQCLIDPMSPECVNVLCGMFPDECANLQR
jgi:hypothetical protein